MACKGRMLLMDEKSIGIKNNNDYRTGLICVLGCQLFWGFCPIYWQALVPIPSWTIILYRIVTMFVFSYIAARMRYSREEIWQPLRGKGVFKHHYRLAIHGEARQVTLRIVPYRDGGEEKLLAGVRAWRVRR